MATTDLTLGVRERARQQIVDQLVRLLQRCDEFDLLLEDCLDEAERNFLEQVDAKRPTLSIRRRAAAPIVLVTSPAKLKRYHARNTIVEKLAARGVSQDIAGLALALGRSVRYVHALVREESRTLLDPNGHTRVADFRVHLRRWPSRG